MSVRILIADDHQVFRQGLRTLLERESNFVVVGEAEDGLGAVRLAEELSPEVVIMDVNMPDLNGIEATRRLHGSRPGIRVIALSMHSHRQFVQEMFTAGAAGYLLKECAFEEVVRSVQEVRRGNFYLCPKLSSQVLGEYLRGGAASGAGATAFTLLTVREREVLQLVAEGQSTKEIAVLLGVSAKTVETFRQRLMKKLGVHSVAGLTKYAIREGLTGLEK